MESEKKFKITTRLSDQEGEKELIISHTDETFSLDFNGQTVSIINNGDNSWSIVTGNIAQETVNQIGEAIEQYYHDQSL